MRSGLLAGLRHALQLHPRRLHLVLLRSLLQQLTCSWHNTLLSAQLQQHNEEVSRLTHKITQLTGWQYLCLMAQPADIIRANLMQMQSFASQMDRTRNQA